MEYFLLIFGVYAVLCAVTFRKEIARFYALFKKSFLYGYIGALLYETGVVLITAGVLGYFFIHDEHITIEILAKLLVYGIIAFTIGYYINTKKDN